MILSPNFVAEVDKQLYSSTHDRGTTTKYLVPTQVGSAKFSSNRACTQLGNVHAPVSGIMVDKIKTGKNVTNLYLR